MSRRIIEVYGNHSHPFALCVHVCKVLTMRMREQLSEEFLKECCAENFEGHSTLGRNYALMSLQLVT